MAETWDKHASIDCTNPYTRVERKIPPNYQARKEIEKLKIQVPIKILKQKVEACELRDYRVKAEKLTPKGEYFGMKNFHRSLSVASYFSRGILYSYPQKPNTPSLLELVSAEDNGAEDDVFESGFSTSRSEPGTYSSASRQIKSDSELMRPCLTGRDNNNNNNEQLKPNKNMNKSKMNSKSKLLCAVNLKKIRNFVTLPEY